MTASTTSSGPSQFDGRVVAITGAASGIGAACAREFAARGAAVEIIDLDAERAQAVRREIDTSEPWIGDIADAAFCRQTIDAVASRNGRLDVLVNAAGTIHRADALGTDDHDWQRVMRTNVDGMFYLCRAAVPHLRGSDGASIVNFGSIWGGVAAAGALAYCVSKGAVHQLTRALALDHVDDGIRVNAVAPGEVRTPMLSSHRPEPPTEADLQALADATIPMRRLAEPVEIARVVAFLASDDASYMTGEIVHVDAGYTAR